MATSTFNSTGQIISTTGSPYSSSQVAAINSAREANVNNGVSAYSGNGATANSIATGQTANGTGTPLYAAPAMINSSNMKGATPINIPPTPTPSNAGTQAMTALAGNAAAATPTAPATTPNVTDTSPDTAFQTYLKSIQAPVNTAEMYQQDLSQSGVQQDQQQVNTYQAQLNAITAKAQADKLSLVGQGNGVPQPIIGGQQAEIDREAAIQALPVSAQLSAAQGNLTEAQNNVDTLFKLQAADAQAQNSYQNSLVTAVYNFATSEQKAQLDALTKTNDQKFTTQQNNLNYAQSLSSAAIQNGQPGIAAQLMKLDPTDPNYQSNIATFAKGIQVVQKTTSTKEPTAADAIASLSLAINSGQPLKDGTPVTDANGFITPKAWKAIASQAPQEKVPIEDLIKEFGYKLYTTDGTVDPAYGLSPVQQKLITG